MVQRADSDSPPFLRNTPAIRKHSRWAPTRGRCGQAAVTSTLETPFAEVRVNGTGAERTIE